MKIYPRSHASLLLLALLAGGCASSAGHVSSQAPAPAMVAPSGQYRAVIDGTEVACPNIPMGDDATIQRILDEGKNRCQVMDRLKYLTSEIGPRLTGSSNALKANQWCLAEYEKWGLSNAHLEQWGTIGTGFDRGPSTGKLLIKHVERGPRRRPDSGNGAAASERPGAAIKPADADKPSAPATKPAPAAAPASDVAPAEPGYDSLRDIQFTTMSWTAGTSGSVRGPVIKEPKTDEEFEKVKDKLPGAWILIDANEPVPRGYRSVMAARYDLRAKVHEKATDKADAKDLSIPEREALLPVAGYISPSRNELVITSGVPHWRELEADKVPHDVHVLVTREDYDAMNSRLADGEEIYAEFDLHHRFIKGPVPVYNTVAEIKGSKWPDQVVIVSGHLDSWDGPGSQGANDNGTGTVVTLEAARILMAAHAKPLRTIRFVDWTGEEQGLLGSHAYVKAHESELDKISAVLVDDGGTNSEGGLTVADQMVDMLAAATAPTNNQFYDDVDKRFLNVNIKHGGDKIRTHGASDHASFNQVHVPGFFWDEVGRADYNHVHHTQFDRIEFSIDSYLKQSATNAAITAYRLACAPTLLPREVVPPPVDEKKDGKQAGAEK